MLSGVSVWAGKWLTRCFLQKLESKMSSILKYKPRLSKQIDKAVVIYVDWTLHMFYHFQMLFIFSSGGFPIILVKSTATNLISWHPTWSYQDEPNNDMDLVASRLWQEVSCSSSPFRFRLRNWFPFSSTFKSNKSNSFSHKNPFQFSDLLLRFILH